MKSGFTLFLLLTVSLINLQSDVTATEVVPPKYRSIPGNSQIGGLLNNVPSTLQLLIHSSQLTSFVGKNLTAISWRNPTSASSNWPPIDVNILSFRILLSASVDPANRSLAHFSDNVVGPQI